MKRYPMTTAGAERLRAELQRLKTVERPTIVRAIGEARLHGDISENAEYHAAKERQGFIEARIRDIESKLADAHVVNPAEIDAGGKIVFGATVDLVDLASGDKVSYQIVGDDDDCGHLNGLDSRSVYRRVLASAFDGQHHRCHDGREDRPRHQSRDCFRSQAIGQPCEGE